ncbi:MAG: hydrogenase 3 maturation endopeptidase HyCI [Sedimentisphaerales bacterium]|jgi:hydrogenase 3 maturation protease
MPAKILKQKLNNAQRVAVLGVGSELRGDDVAGLLVAQQIEKTITEQTMPEIRVFIGETAPENLTGEIKKFQPTHLIIIDAAELNKKPGHIEIMEPQTIGGTSFCTHSLPLKVIIGYLLESFKFQAIIIGIQPKTLVFGAQPTKEVVAAAKHIAKTITALFKTAK